MIFSFTLPGNICTSSYTLSSPVESLPSFVFLFTCCSVFLAASHVMRSHRLAMMSFGLPVKRVWQKLMSIRWTTPSLLLWVFNLSCYSSSLIPSVPFSMGFKITFSWNTYIRPHPISHSHAVTPAFLTRKYPAAALLLLLFSPQTSSDEVGITLSYFTSCSPRFKSIEELLWSDWPCHYNHSTIYMHMKNQVDFRDPYFYILRQIWRRSGSHYCESWANRICSKCFPCSRSTGRFFKRSPAGLWGYEACHCKYGNQGTKPRLQKTVYESLLRLAPRRKKVPVLDLPSELYLSRWRVLNSFPPSFFWFLSTYKGTAYVPINILQASRQFWQALFNISIYIYALPSPQGSRATSEASRCSQGPSSWITQGFTTKVHRTWSKNQGFEAPSIFREKTAGTSLSLSPWNRSSRTRWFVEQGPPPQTVPTYHDHTIEDWYRAYCVLRSYSRAARRGELEPEEDEEASRSFLRASERNCCGSATDRGFNVEEVSSTTFQALPRPRGYREVRVSDRKIGRPLLRISWRLRKRPRPEWPHRRGFLGITSAVQLH